MVIGIITMYTSYWVFITSQHHHCSDQQLPMQCRTVKPFQINISGQVLYSLVAHVRKQVCNLVSQELDPLESITHIVSSLQKRQLLAFLLYPL